jgi:hypothetical protein
MSQRYDHVRVIPYGNVPHREGTSRPLIVVSKPTGEEYLDHGG